MKVPLGLNLLHHYHGVGLPQQGPGCSQLSQLDQLNHDLLVQIDQLLVRQFECGRGLEDRVPVAVVDVCHEGVLRVHCVKRDARLLLEDREGPTEVTLLEVLLDQTDNVR